MEGQAAPAHIPHRPQGGMFPEAPLWPSQEGEWGTGHMNNLLDPHSGLVHTQVLQVADGYQAAALSCHSPPEGPSCSVRPYPLLASGRSTSTHLYPETCLGHTLTPSTLIPLDDTATGTCKTEQGSLVAYGGADLPRESTCDRPARLPCPDSVRSAHALRHSLTFWPLAAPLRP